jgi:PAS domain S-box-containing protein
LQLAGALLNPMSQQWAKSIFIVQSMRVRYASRMQAGKGMAVDVEQPDWLLQIEGILESLNEGVLITDECQAIVFANSNLEEMTGFTRSELVGLDIYNVYAKEEADFIVEQRELGLRVGKNRFEFVLPRQDGSRLPVIISARAVEDPEGRRYSIVTFTDISDVKRVEQELRFANKRRTLPGNSGRSHPCGARPTEPRAQIDRLGWS